MLTALLMSGRQEQAAAAGVVKPRAHVTGLGGGRQLLAVANHDQAKARDDEKDLVAGPRAPDRVRRGMSE